MAIAAASYRYVVPWLLQVPVFIRRSLSVARRRSVAAIKIIRGVPQKPAAYFALSDEGANV
jgi:hypothetical protein